jgi:hypothetical protein
MTFLKGEILDCVRSAIGKEPLPENSIHGLVDLPKHVVIDLAVIQEHCGTLSSFAYLYHVTDASFSDVKTYLDNNGWINTVD